MTLIYFKAINERDKELRSALVQTSLKQISDICTLTEKYLHEDDDRVAFSGKVFYTASHIRCELMLFSRQLKILE